MAHATACKTHLGGCVLQKRCLGKTNILVSVMGLGTVKWGRNQAVKYPVSFSLPSDQEIKNLLSCASDLGINLLDTAPAYGVSEERLGKLLSGSRKNWVISTKVGEEFVDGQSQFHFSSDAIFGSIERSLKRLQTDYLDIVLVHSDGEDLRLIEEEQVFETLHLLKKAGKIRAYGMSTKTILGGMRTIDLADVAMVTLNKTQQEESQVIAYANQHQKGIFIKKALLSGHLQIISSEDPVTEAMHFVFEKPGVTSVIVGTINPLHLQENAEKMLKVLA